MLPQIKRVHYKNFPKGLYAVTEFDEFLESDTYLFLRTYANEGFYQFDERKNSFENIADATVKFIAEVFNRDNRIRDFADYIGSLGANVHLIPVQAYKFIEESSEAYTFEKTNGGSNLMSLLSALVLKEIGNVNVDFSIRQSESVSRNASNNMHRFMFPTMFDGGVNSERSYVVFDDHIKTGNTVVNLASHLMNSGAQVHGFAALSCNEIALPSMDLTSKRLDELREGHGHLEEGFQKIFGYNFEYLTRVEADMFEETIPANTESLDDLLKYRQKPEKNMFPKPEIFKEDLHNIVSISLKPLSIKKDLVLHPCDFS